MKRLTLGLILPVALAAITSVPAFGGDSGTVQATVTVQDVACITVGTTSIGYGAKLFSSTSGMVTANGTISNIDSCSQSVQTLRAKGSSATGSGFSWTLKGSAFTCSSSSGNEFRHQISTLPSGTMDLTTNDQTVGTLSANQQDVSLSTILTMPCAGSNGVGQQATTTITLTATVP